MNPIDGRRRFARRSDLPGLDEPAGARASTRADAGGGAAPQAGEVAPIRPVVGSRLFGWRLRGGQNGYFGNFNTRGDAAVSLFSELRGIGLNNLGLIRRLGRRLPSLERGDNVVCNLGLDPRHI